MTVAPKELAHAVLASVVDGSYPDSEDVAGAELTPGALPEIIQYLQKAQDDIYEDIRKVSRDNAPELDSWIAQARRLNDDIATSHTKADEILKLAELEAELEKELEDAEVQARFLQGEIRFNDQLASILGQLQLIGATLGQVEILTSGGELGDAIEVLSGAEGALEKMQGAGGETIVVGLMREKAAALRKGLVEKVASSWSELVGIDQEAGSIKIRRDITAGEAEFSGETIVKALQMLDLLNGKVDMLHQQIDALLITPRLDTRKGSAPAFSVDGGTLRIVGYRSNDMSAKQMFADLRLIFSFLNSNLPPSVTPTLSRILVPSLTTRFISTTLSRSVPSSLDDLPQFESLLDETRKFEDYLQGIHWTEETELREWADRAPKVWLAKKRETCLDKLRTIVARGVKETKVVERTETEKVKKHDRRDSIGPKVAQDVWNEDWKDEEETPAVATGATKSLQMAVDDDDEEASGWGLDEDLDIEEEPEEPKEEPEKTVKDKPEPAGDDGLEDLDWGEWGEDVDEPTNPATPVTADFTPSTSESAKSNSPPSKSTLPNTMSKDVTLKENYTITFIPDAILELIIQVLSESTRLSILPRSSITSAAPGLLTLPSLILAAYRALAPIHYSAIAASNMYLYNDCMRISEQLLLIDNSTGLTFTTAEKGDVALVSSLGKRTYAKEINSQRTILTDYLDSAQGFVNCTEYPQSVECETAISSTISHIRELHHNWSSVLSLSALLQSLGSLLNTVVIRLINDIEDMADIAAAESEKLGKFCEDLAQLEAFFPEGPGGMTTIGVYCAHWIKFRFLQQILESTMADILYMFREGHLEGFGVEELVELVVALFADSENRRRCIDEIRRGRA